jgi:Tfp pilus assembly protein PilX
MRFSISRLEERRGERGQVLVIVALMFIVLIGAMALAVDLSATTDAHRVIANWSDASAIAGVRDCDSVCNAKTEVGDAIKVVLQNSPSPWNSDPTWAANALASGAGSGGGACTSSSTSCVVTDYPGPTGFANYRVSVSSPPATPTNAAYNTTNYVEVHIKQTLTATFAGLLGIPTTKTIGHSVAYDAGPSAPYQYSFFAKKQTGGGNQNELIQGDAYVGAGYLNQSSGHANLCIAELGEPSPDNLDSGAPDTPAVSLDDDLDNQGHVVFSDAPQSVGNAPSYATVCTSASGTGALNVEQGIPLADNSNCPSGSTSTPGGGLWYCVAPNPPLPNIPSPTPTLGLSPLGCGATVDLTTPPGVYRVTAGCSIKINLDSGNIECVSLVLGGGSSVSVSNQPNKGDKTGSHWMTAYGFVGGAQDPIAEAAMEKVSTPIPEPATRCPGANLTLPDSNNDRAVIWAPDPGPPPPPKNGNTVYPTALSNNDTGCCTVTLFTGTIFLPNQQVNFNANQALEDVGSVYVGDWEVQSGNQPNPVVTYDTNATEFIPTLLRIAE